jgi:hypothetical protein
MMSRLLSITGGLLSIEDLAGLRDGKVRRPGYKLKWDAS